MIGACRLARAWGFRQLRHPQDEAPLAGKQAHRLLSTLFTAVGDKPVDNP
jgi:hypothetical protein